MDQTDLESLRTARPAIGPVPGGYVPKGGWCLRGCANSGKGDPTVWWPADRLAVSIEGVLLLNAQDSAALDRGGPEIGFWFCRVDSSVAWYGNGENWKLAAMR